MAAHAHTLMTLYFEHMNDGDTEKWANAIIKKRK